MSYSTTAAATACRPLRMRLSTRFPTASLPGGALLVFIASFGELLRVGVEGTNSCGAGLNGQ